MIDLRKERDGVVGRHGLSFSVAGVCWLTALERLEVVLC